MIRIGIPVYQHVDLLDVAGPYEMFNWVNPIGTPRGQGLVDTFVLSLDGRAVTSHDGFTFHAHESFADAPRLDVLWVPGGSADALKAITDEPDGDYLCFLRRASSGARYVCSVCEGAVLLAAAGLLDGYTATTHWAFKPCMARYGVTLADGNPRYVRDRDRLTGGGISSGLDEALALIELLWGTQTAQAVQQTTQYYPRPPVDSPIPAATSCPIPGWPS